MPLIRRIPKRGFNNKAFGTSYLPVNLTALNTFDDGAIVDAAVLKKAGIAKGNSDGVKVLGTGELTKKLTVRAAAFSAAAKAAIEKLGGSAEVVS
jgi:large subunit ribosomal protein L15